MSPRKLLPLFRLGVRQKVLLVLLTVLLVALSASGWLALQAEKQDALDEIERRGNDISRYIASSLAYSVVGYDYQTLQMLLDEITLSEDIGYAKVSNARGKPMAESGSPPEAGAEELVMFNQNIILENDIVGQLALGLSTASTVRHLENRNLALIQREAIIIILIAIGEFLALSFLIIRPVSIMTRALNEGLDDNGQLTTTVPVVSDDEFGQLATQFNRLGAQLNEANRRLQSKVEAADEQLLQTNRQLLQQSSELRRISEEYQRLSITDPLTGLYNRRRFDKMMEEEMALSARHGDINSLVIIDIDNFKDINDHHGHPGGDKVLKQLARIIKLQVRKTDIVCRIGGEEFAVLCKRSDAPSAMDIGEKIRIAVAEQPIHLEGETVQITVSVGVATHEPSAATLNLDTFYQQADSASYFSKTSGRNRTTHFSDIPPSLRYAQSRA